MVDFWEEMGSDIKGKVCFRCDTPHEWIETLNRLLSNGVRKFNQEIYDLFVQKFSYDAVRDALKKIIEE